MPTTTEGLASVVADGCVFCGQTPLTVEHVFSTTWLQSVFRPTADFTTTLHKRDAATGEAKDRTWIEKASKKGKRFGPHVKCVCAECNSGWMKVMDEAIAPVLTPLASGERGVVSSEGVEMLAAWATKIALVLDSALDVPALDPALKRKFRDDPKPMPDSLIWIAAASPVDDRVRTRANTLNPTPSAHDPQAYLATFGAIHVLFQVFIPTTEPPIFIKHRREVAGFMHPFWRHGHGMKLSWPPPEESWLQSEQDFEDVASLIEGAPTEPGAGGSLAP